MMSQESFLLTFSSSCSCSSTNSRLSFMDVSVIGSGLAGLFITFEGSEDCGTSTQVKRLENRLRALNREPVIVHEPGYTEIGAEIRHLLLHAKAGQSMQPET